MFFSQYLCCFEKLFFHYELHEKTKSNSLMMNLNLLTVWVKRAHIKYKSDPARPNVWYGNWCRQNIYLLLVSPINLVYHTKEKKLSLSTFLEICPLKSTMPLIIGIMNENRFHFNFDETFTWQFVRLLLFFLVELRFPVDFFSFLCFLVPHPNISVSVQTWE